jgi:integrase
LKSTKSLTGFIPAFPKRDNAIKTVKNSLTWEEQMEVINVLPDRFRLIFLFFACHGKRIRESLSLKWEHIDFKQKTFRIYQSKIKTEQCLPLHEVFSRNFQSLELSIKLKMFFITMEQTISMNF